MFSKIGVVDDISQDEWNYRLENLVYSQSLLTCFRRSKGEFVDKYIRNIFWNDEKAKDIEYEKNMSYGRDFHLECQRIFMGISDNSECEFIRLQKIKKQYEDKYKYIDFCTECTIETNTRISATLDLLVKIYDEEGNLKEVCIWDWKVENKEITKENASRRMQTAVYMYTVKETIAKEIDFNKVVMYYYQPKINKNIKINYSKELHEKYSNVIWETIKAIKTMDRNGELDEC